MRNYIKGLFLIMLPFSFAKAQDSSGTIERIKMTTEISNSISPKLSEVPKEDVIFGSPQHKTWYLDKNPNGITFGIWEGTIGKWKFSVDHWEYCGILSGESIISDSSTGQSYNLKAGDSFVLQPGFKGTWQALSITRKEFVVK